MARAALGISVRELADRADVADSTIHRFESNKGGMQTGTLERIQSALEAEGIVFVSADFSGGPGVRFKG
nr:helix-turn-helix transcriptional regulator [Caulobacter sp.]